MIVYILNFVLCSGLLLLVYRAFLGYENLYRFNRFYLLFSLVFSLAVPFITIGVQHIKVPVLNQQIISQKVAAVVNSPAHQQVTDQPVINEPVHAVTIPVRQQAISPSMPVVTVSPVRQPILQTPKHNYFPYLLAIYIMITLVMLGRLAFNGYKIACLVAKNAVIPCQDIKLVLLEEEVTPHSFLKYVFINKNDYQDGLIEPEIICHEQTHAKQLHSLDVIAVELLRAVCWFNPFISFYRRAMQLNHEFLADEAVVKNYDNTPAYQYLLLSKAGQCGSLYLTSQFNYLATKKRLMMMTKTTSAKIALYKKLALAPLIVYALLLFCNKGIAQTTRAAVKSVYKNVAIAIDKISLATDPAPEKIIINEPLATENAADSTITQPQLAVNVPLTVQNGDNVTNIQTQAFITDTSTRKLPNVQQVSLRAPADIQIDGKATEWNNRFQAYNDSTHFYYTIANDDKNLYLTVQASDPAIINMIVGGGVTLSINKTGEKNFEDAEAITYPDLKDANYPVLAKNDPAFLKETWPFINFNDIKTRPDSFAMASNSRLAARSKFIWVTGIDRLAELTSVSNSDGIKVATLLDNKMVYTYELAINLSLLGLDAAKSEKFAYNISLGNPMLLLRGEFFRNNVRGPVYITFIPHRPPPSPFNPHGYGPADFWGEYTLAK